MKHWHECGICKEYFECACSASHRVLAFCDDCVHMRRESVEMSSIVLGLSHITLD